MLLSSDRFILMTLAGLCRRPSSGCEWHKACLGGNRCRFSGAEALLCTAAETDCTGLGAPVVRQEPNQRIFKLGRGSVLISFDINFWNLYNRDSSLLSEDLSEDAFFFLKGSFLFMVHSIVVVSSCLLLSLPFPCLGVSM
ncbi:hypothetical protein ACN38_g798 [Penicillium nordicum]|uniref:Uncharacterized protein n=1 Tax=Penicillium nordicum TaxID=229535 RepID=A0A0M9WKD7_9EURO|nr:hypothetical protein ACN38_g798 [Penicillium nordicum]